MRVVVGVAELIRDGVEEQIAALRVQVRRQEPIIDQSEKIKKKERKKKG